MENLLFSYSSTHLPLIYKRFRIRPVDFFLPKTTGLANFISVFYVNLIVFLCFIAATRETAFLHAISSAAITHELTLQCRLNRIPGCKCGKTRKQPKANSGWQWGGCTDDIKFGEKETRRFIDKLEKGNDARTAFNLHNNEVGRKVNNIFCSFENQPRVLGSLQYLTID